MIQRIQSVLLFFAGAGFLSLFKFPFASTSSAEAPIFEDNVFLVTDHTVLLVLTILGGLVSLVSIFLYNNRGLQIRLGYVGMIIAFFLGLVAIWLIYSNASQWSESLQMQDGAGIYIAGITLFLIITSNYFINKDEKTVRSMDRLR